MYKTYLEIREPVLHRAKYPKGGTVFFVPYKEKKMIKCVISDVRWHGSNFGYALSHSGEHIITVDQSTIAIINGCMVINGCTMSKDKQIKMEPFMIHAINEFIYRPPFSRRND